MNTTELLDESLQWLRQHPAPECADLPLHLIDHWKLSLPAQPGELPAPAWGIPLAIYGFGYLQSRLLAKPAAASVSVETYAPGAGDDLATRPPDGDREPLAFLLRVPWARLPV